MSYLGIPIQAKDAAKASHIAKAKASVYLRKIPKDILITQGTYCGQIVQENPKAFPLFVRPLGYKTKKYSAEGLLEENPDEGFTLSLGTV